MTLTHATTTLIRHVALGSALLAAAGSAQGVALLDGFGGPEGYGELSQPRNDDGSSSELDLPFNIDFFGQSFDTFFVNNNGNMTFGGPTGTFTPSSFPNTTGRPMIAPFWADVDTRCETCGSVYVASGQTSNPDDTVVVTWANVGHYSREDGRTNSFQAVLRDRADTGAGNFDIDFRYERLQWTTGDASGGTDGLGGTPAQAGFDANDGSNFFTLPGSQTAAVLDLQNNSNVSLETPGLWTFAVRNGDVPDGSDASNPLLPVITDAGFQFDFNAPADEIVFIDPEIAIGYDYVVDSQLDIRFAAMLVPEALPGGDAMFELLLEGLDPIIFAAGAEVDLTIYNPEGFNRFGIRGIDVAESLDPTDTFAFVTGLRFTADGPVRVVQTPVTAVVGVSVPEPSTLVLIMTAMLLGAATRRRA